MNDLYTSTDHFVLLPAIMLALFGCALLLFEFVIPAGRRGKHWLLFLALAGLGFTGRSLWMRDG